MDVWAGGPSTTKPTGHIWWGAGAAHCSARAAVGVAVIIETRIPDGTFTGRVHPQQTF